MREELQKKVDWSISRLQKGERLALLMQPDFGYYLAFSGGKDSQCVLELAKMAGVKYKAVYNVTTNDPAENVRFIKKYYPDVIFDVPKKSYFSMIEERGLPMMTRRWCCDIFKESKGKNCVILTGVRAEESKKRAAYTELMKIAKRKESRGSRDLDAMSDNKFQCVKGRDKFKLYPILQWTESDVWEFLMARNIPINPCYKNNRRVGCIYCPFTDTKKLHNHLETHPKQHAVLLQHLQVFLNKDIDNRPFKNAAECFDWWVSKKSIEKYLQHKVKSRM